MADYDVMVIGAGGAGLTAALYTSRAMLSTIVLEKLTPGGQIALTDEVENYPGFPQGVTGPKISEYMLEQAKKYGAEYELREVASIKPQGKVIEVETLEGNIRAKAVIVATGASYRRLGVTGEEALTGKGVSYCATCDGAFFKGKELVVVGGGDAAMQEGIFLTRYATKITVVHRRDKLRASPILQDRARNNPKISFTWNTVIDSINGAKKVESVTLKHVESGAKQDKKIDGVFVFVGQIPQTGFLKGVLELDAGGYIITQNGSTQTGVKGVFACGEVRSGAVKQLVSACGEGCEAALAAQHYIENQ
ncbi:MAG: thioredoxin-disulfide reductase [Candidatus Omnitrophica bacterium]|nr:thioredoxin-disulfide reductase [Candidatus Omnitrophota bacterium]